MTRLIRYSRSVLMLGLAGFTPMGWSNSASAQVERVWNSMPNMVGRAEPHTWPSSLPDAPSAAMARDSGRYPTGSVLAPDVKTAPKYAFTIEPEYQAYRLSILNKITYAGAEIVTPRFPLVVLLAAGLSHVDDSNPKYGTNSEAFAKRVGAAAARDGSQRIFSHMLLAPILHEDSRYYVMGQGHGVLKRVFYAATRVAIVRRDNGGNSINFADLAGYGGSAALTQLYYPRHGRDLNTILATYGSSLGGLGIAHEIEEFVRFITPGQPR